MSIEASLSDILKSALAFSQAIIEKELGKADYAHRLIQILTPSQPRKTATIALSGLPCLTLLANYGDPQKSVPLVAAWQCIQLAAKVFDDVEDEHPVDSSWRVNAGTGLLFLAQFILLQLRERGVSLSTIYRLSWKLNQFSFKACSGQHRDLTIEPVAGKASPQTWLSVAREKSGYLFAWAAWSGAKAAKSSAAVCQQYHRFGINLGVLLQIADDYNGIWNPDGRSDLWANHATLPVAYFRYVASKKEQTQFDRLIDLGSQGDLIAEENARELLVRTGSQKYCIAAAWMYRQKAKEALLLVNSDSQVKSFLVDMLDQIFPVFPNTGSHHEY